MVHLPLQLTGHGTPVRASTGCHEGGAGHGVDARRGRFRQPAGVVAAAAVQAHLPVDVADPVATLLAQSPHAPSPAARGLRRRGSDLNRPRAAARAFAGGLPRMEYRRLAAHAALPATTLCAISF